MLKQITIKNTKSLIGNFKANIINNIQNKKLADKMYMHYVMNEIKEAEEDIANGGKTYTLEEYRERLRENYGADI